jgi:hypothetical protein
MALPITIPYTFAGATGTAQLSQLDADLSLLASTINGIGSGSVPLANVQITGGSLSNIFIGPTAGGTGLTTAPATGQILIGSGSAYQLSNLTSGTGITITNSGGNVTIAATGNATANSVTVGVTGVASGNSGSILATSGNLLTQIIPGTTGNVLTSNGTAWISQLGGSASNITVGTTGVNSSNSGSVLIASGNVLSQVIPGTSGNVLTSNGTVWISKAATGGGGLTDVYQPSAFTSAAIQTAINSASGAGGGTVLLQAGIYNCTSQIVVAANVKLQGLGQVLYSNSGTGSISGGSILQINWGSGAGTSGNTTYAAVILKNSAGIDNVGFDYPSQTPSASTPTEYGSSVQINDNPCYNQYVTNCIFHKSYIGVDFRGSKCSSGMAGCVIQNNAGSPLSIGIAVDFIVDWGIITNNRFNGGDGNKSSPNTGIALWAQNNGIALYAGGCDWLNVSGMQAYGYSVGIYITGQAGYVGGGPYSFNQCMFDGCFTGVFLSGNISQTVLVEQCTFTPFKPATSAAGSGVAIASGTTLNGLTFNSNYIFANPNYVVWLGQASQTVSHVIVSNNYASVTSSQAAVVVSTGSYVQVINNIFLGFAGGVSSLGSATNTQVAYNNGGGGSGASGITIGSSTITGGTSGRVLIDSSGIVSELAPGSSGNVITSSGGAWVSQAPTSGAIAIGSTPTTGGTAGYLLIDGGGYVAETPQFTMPGQIGSVANGGSYWTGASVFGASGSNWGVEATCSNYSYTGTGALVARVNNTGNAFAAFYYTTSNYGSITVSGGGTAYNTTSDYRLKENVQTAPGGLSTIQAMRPVTYTWSNHPEYGTDTGFIAHELQAVVPNAVSGAKDAVKDDGSIDPQQVNYTKLVPYLVAAIQELAAQVADLKSKLPNT